MTPDPATKSVFGSGLVGCPVEERPVTSYPLSLGPATTMHDVGGGKQETQELQHPSTLLGLGDLGPISDPYGPGFPHL